MAGARIVSNLYKSIYNTKNRNLINLYFFINFCFKVGYVNDNSFINNALLLKDKYDLIVYSFRDLTQEIMQSLHIECNVKRFPGFLTKSDRIFTLVCPELNNIPENPKQVFFELVKNGKEIQEVLKKTKTNS